MAAVEKLCSRVILINKGEIVMSDKTSKVLKFYLDEEKKEVLNSQSGIYNLDLNNKKKFGVKQVDIYCDGERTDKIKSGSSFQIKASIVSHMKLFGPEFGIGISNDQEVSLMRFNNVHVGQSIKVEEGLSEVSLTIDDFPLYKKGDYFVNIYFGDAAGDYEIINNAFSICVESVDVFNSGRLLEDDYNQITHRKIKFN
jgi:hypothetical protein